MEIKQDILSEQANKQIIKSEIQKPDLISKTKFQQFAKFTSFTTNFTKISSNSSMHMNENTGKQKAEEIKSKMQIDIKEMDDR